MRFWALLIGLTLCATPAMAQPLPDSLRSAGVTEAQWGQAQGVIRAQATSLSLREGAVRTLAVEIFEGQPGQSFETYIELIRDGAQRLPQIVAAARALDPRGDTTLIDLQRRAVAAAESGRLREALALQDEYSATFRRALERAVEQPLLDLAASYAAAGDTAYALGDYLGAAARYEQAADIPPAGATEVRWRYRHNQAYALYERSHLFAEPAPLRQAVDLYEGVVLSLAPREARPADWAVTQSSLGNALRLQGERGEPGALERAAAAFEAALTVRTLEADPAGWAATQNDLGWALRAQGERGAPGALRRAVAAYEASLATTSEADPIGWASTQMNLGIALTILSDRGDEHALEQALAAYEEALSVFTRDAHPIDWARTQNNRGLALIELSDRSETHALEPAVVAFEAALTVRTRDTNPAGWAQTQNNLGIALTKLGQRGVPGALERATAAYDAALTVMTRSTNPAGWALTQRNLGISLRIQGERGAPGFLERAVAAFEAALTVDTREANPAGWADTTLSLAVAHRSMGRVAEARAAAQEALEVYEQTGNRYFADRARAFIARLPEN